MRKRALRVVVATIALVALLTGAGALRQSLGGGDDGLTVFGGADEGAGEALQEEADYSDDAPGGRFAQGGGSTGAGAGLTTSSATVERRQALDAGGDDFAAGDGGGSSTGAALPPIPAGDRIIKDGRLEIEVPRDGFDRAYQQVVALAARVGGQVVSSQTSRQEDHASGEVTIRVPAQRFEELLAASGGIGEVRHREISSQDVSGEFVDLQSRLRHLQAQETFYLRLMGEAEAVGDAIAINQHLSSVQAEIEQIQGRLRLLDERTTYSRLTLAIHEPGVGPLLSRFPEHRGVLAAAWAEAVRALQETLGALLVGAFTLAPLLALGLVGWALWRRLRPRPAGPGDPRPAEQEKEGPLPVG